ncbi:trypsin alpha-4-like [Drosophila ficusphila]|uniref:trypsin alpha-4-like n=1 Tax=Drosophila ficusphila TaxID=30025 RepID=UPI001C8A892A|nr:trypsin alpha-4-like [Drosophila ficusphila]
MFTKCFLLLSTLNFLSAGRVLQPEERIIGGEDIEIEEAPWQVSLQFRGHHKCGGSIYSRDIIITAAHCRFTKEGKQLEAEDFQVRAGSSWKNSNGIFIQVEAIKSHKEYKHDLLGPDIAVMRLSEPLGFSSESNTYETIYAYRVGQSSCSGDSGGALVVDQQQVGVAAWVPTDYCEGNVAFAGVPYFRNWILNAIESF